MKNPALSVSSRALRWLIVVHLISMGAMELSGPFWPLHLRTVGNLTPAELAWAVGIAYAGPMIMAICLTSFWGRIGDRTGHKPMLLRALLALSATQWWIANADSVVQVLAARMAQGGLAGSIAAAQAYGTCLVSREQRGNLIARLQVATAVGSLIGPFAGGWVFDEFGFRTLNIAAALLCAGCAIVVWRVLPDASAHATPTKSQPASDGSFALGAVYGLLIAIITVQAGKMMPQTFFALYTEQILNMPSWLTGLCYGATALGLCIGAPFWAKRFAREPDSRVLCEVQWVCLACAVVVAIQGAVSAPAVVILARICWGILMAALLPVFYALISRDTPDELQGWVLGVANSAAKAGALVGTAGGAVVLAWVPINYAFWPVAVLYVISGAALYRIRKGRRSGGAAEVDVAA